jgi:menaquinone-dependent protoporphyrinogen IX oxidase
METTHIARILVAYTTNAGTTAEVAQVVAEELGRSGAQVDVRRLEEVTGLDGYAAVVIGAPMIVGWHKAAIGFLKKNQQALSRVPVAYFLTARSLTQTGETSVDAIPIAVDPELAKTPKKATGLSFRERYATAANYVRPILKAAPLVRPVSIGLFGGKLELFRLKLWQVLFVMLIIQVQPGGSFNRTFIREWATDVRFRLLPDNSMPVQLVT